MRSGGRPGRGVRPASGPARRGDAGMVTAELAVGFPVLVLAGLLGATGIQLVTAQLRCLDAAGVAARLAARGELSATVRSQAMAAAPGDAQLQMDRRGDVVDATVSVQVHPLGLARLLPAFTVTAAAAEAAEPGPP